jgi:DtxR family Mn-dependent transcriptional regulator
MATPVMESYLETIYNLMMEEEAVIAARLAERFHISPPTVSETLSRMVKQGFITLDARKNIHLTAEGRTMAESGLRRHRLLERMLVDMFGLDWTEAHEEAHRLEHGLSPMLEARMLTVMGEPETCPHGNPMPGVTPLPTRPLEKLRPGERARVERIPDQFEHEAGFLEYLDSQGVKPGVTLELIESGPALLRVAIEGSVRSLRPDCGQKVWMAL